MSEGHSEAADAGGNTPCGVLNCEMLDVGRKETYCGFRRKLDDRCAGTKLMKARSAKFQINLRMRYSETGGKNPNSDKGGGPHIVYQNMMERNEYGVQIMSLQMLENQIAGQQ